MKLELAILFLSLGEKAQSTDQQANQVSQVAIGFMYPGLQDNMNIYFANDLNDWQVMYIENNMVVCYLHFIQVKK